MKRIMLLLAIVISGAVLFDYPSKTALAANVRENPVNIATSAAKVGWETQWEKILAEARKEGKVVLYGPPIAPTRQAFIEVFQKSYPGIKLDYLALGGSQVPPRINTERSAGLYLPDVHVGGTTTTLTQLKKFARPIKPFLVLPEVKDGKAWMDGKLYFSDKAGEINIGFAIRANSNMAYNINLVKQEEITSFWDLTKPKWKGQIIMQDPRAAGAGLAMATFWYFNKQLGPDFIKAFADNKPILTRDLRLQTEWVARGKYSIIVASDTATVSEFRKAGAPLDTAALMKEGTFSTSAFGAVIVMDKAPHPNAATVFINWLLSKEGQTVWSTSSGFASRRLDVPTGHLLEEMRIIPGRTTYTSGDDEAVVMSKDEVVLQMNKMFAGF